MAEELLFDHKESKYFQAGVIEVTENDDWDYVVNSYFLRGELVHKEQLLSEELSRDMEQEQGLEETLGKYFNEKSDTGDDLSRTGPGGNAPADNYDGTYYEGQSDSKVHAATGYEIEPDAKQIYDIDGTIPELQEDIVIEIKIKDESQEDDTIELLEPGDLKNHEGRKDPGTHINTIKAGEKGIEDLIPISDIWKTANDGMVESKSFSWIGEAINDNEAFKQPSSWIGKVTWNPDTMDATVQMNGKTYNHSGVTGKDFESFRGAPSKGAHWNRFWKGRFQATNFSEALMLSHKDQYEFDWIDDNAIEEMKKYAAEQGSGKFILAVVSGDTKTDHRSEGRDEHQRHWTREELIQNIRTGKGKMTDLNHLWPKKDPESGGVFDANWNFKTDRGEMILWETDQEILDAIRKDIITAVSINTGAPRNISTACDTGECFLQPQGTVLGEGNGVALAFVVTDPAGFNYNGQTIPAFPPGMKFTKLYIVE